MEIKASIALLRENLASTKDEELASDLLECIEAGEYHLYLKAMEGRKE